MPGQLLVYGLRDPRTSKIRYVGKSARGIRRAREHICPRYLRGNNHRVNWIKQLLAQGLVYEIEILDEPTRDNLAEQERWWIARGRQQGWPLTNATLGGDGGDTFSGKKHSPETIEKMRRAQAGRGLGRKLPLETRERLKAQWSQKTPEERARISRLGFKHSEETKKKIAERNHMRIGWHHTPEARAKMSAARRLKDLSK